jgi:hypothetical protein
MQRRRRTNTRGCVGVAAGTCLLLLAACGEDGNSVDPNDRLCNGETGFGLLIEGRAQPIEFCVDDSDVSVVLTSLNHYDVHEQVTTPEADAVVRMVFAVQDFPVSLRVTSDLSETVTDPGVVWLYYREIPAGGDPIESFAVDQGEFTLSFVDEDVAAGVLSAVLFDMRDFTTGDPVGQRSFAEGVFSISTKEPALSPSPGLTRTAARR